MDFRQITQPTNPRPAAPTAEPDPSDYKEHRVPSRRADGRNWLQMFNGALLIAIALLVALVALAVTNSSSKAADAQENAYVGSSKYQAVFLNNGQVYFGNITTLTNDYLRLTNVYYLPQDGTTTSSGTYSLVKLGCQQIHDPYDAMIINRSQITFWENLQDKGKVASSITDFKKKNPNGPDCSQVSSQTQADSTANTQGSKSTNK